MKYKMLGVLSVLAFLGINTFEYNMPTIKTADLNIRSTGILKFKNIYEPSAVQQLLDGRLLIVEDEPLRALNIVQFQPDGSIAEDALLGDYLTESFNRKLNDLEGLTMDANGYIYAITSHSRTRKGKRKKNREQMLRFKIKGNTIAESSVYTGLADYLMESDIFERFLKSHNISFRDINIEALSFDKDGKKLLLGFRAPLINGKSMIISLNNPVGIFERDERPKLEDNIMLLDLGGGGIRSLDFDRYLDAYLIVNEIEGHDGKRHSQLWLWSGEADQKPKLIDLPEMKDIKNVESIAPVTVNGENRIILVGDNGKIKKKKPANYLLLNYDQFYGWAV